MVYIERKQFPRLGEGAIAAVRIEVLVAHQRFVNRQHQQAPAQRGRHGGEAR